MKQKQASRKRAARIAAGITVASLLAAGTVSAWQDERAIAAEAGPWVYPVLLAHHQSVNVASSPSSATELHEFVWNSSSATFEQVDASRAFQPHDIVGDRLITMALGTAPDGTIVSRTVSHARADWQEEDNVTPLQWSAGTEGVTLSWAVATQDPVSWTVTRDGVVVHQGIEQAFSDPSADREVNHDYVITGAETITQDGATYLRPYTFKVTIPTTDFGSIGLMLDNPAVVEVEKNQDITSLEPAELLLADPIIDRTHHWETFIPEEAVEVPPACIDTLSTGAVYFGGDNRTFKLNRLSPGTFRTRITIPFTFTGTLGTADLWSGIPLIKDVGYTKTYDADGIWLNSAQAPSSGIFVEYDESTLDFGSYTVSHSVADPLCALAPPIDYRINFTSDNLGWMSISGNHDQAPGHEAFYQASNDAMLYAVNYCWYRFNNRGLDWLLGYSGSFIYPQAYVDLDVNPLVAPPSCTII